jgi:hypothetical protein
MIEQYKILSPYIKNCTTDESFKYEDFNKEKVIEVHLSASSLVRKPYTICRIKNLISKHKLDLKCWEDKTMINNDRFIISK